jgi:hypothetical protein
MSVIGGLDRALDSAKITAFQSTIIGLCALMAMIDGMDTQAIGLVAPAIASDWHVPAAAFGPVFGSSLFSGLIGALVGGQAGPTHPFDPRPAHRTSSDGLRARRSASDHHLNHFGILSEATAPEHRCIDVLRLSVRIGTGRSAGSTTHSKIWMGRHLLYRRRGSFHSATGFRPHHAGVNQFFGLEWQAGQSRSTLQAARTAG